MSDTRLFWKGSVWTVVSVVEGGESPAETFLGSFDDAPGSREWKASRRLRYLVMRQADMMPGEYLTGDKLHRLKGPGGLVEFKADQLRLFGFFSSMRRLVLTNGHGGKKHTAVRAGERVAIQRALDLRRRFVDS